MPHNDVAASLRVARLRVAEAGDHGWPVTSAHSARIWRRRFVCRCGHCTSILCAASEQLDEVLEKLPKGMSLSVGLVDGRNVWKTDLQQASELLRRVVNAIGEERTIVGPSCSLLHVPVDLDLERALDASVRPWLAFARQKLAEIVTLARSIHNGDSRLTAELTQNAVSHARSP